MARPPRAARRPPMRSVDRTRAGPALAVLVDEALLALVLLLRSKGRRCGDDRRRDVGARPEDGEGESAVAARLALRRLAPVVGDWLGRAGSLVGVLRIQEPPGRRELDAIAIRNGPHATKRPVRERRPSGVICGSEHRRERNGPPLSATRRPWAPRCEGEGGVRKSGGDTATHGARSGAASPSTPTLCPPL